MALSCDSEFLFIGRGEESFLENYSFELSEDPGSQGGKVFMALEITNNQGEAEDIGEAIFSNFREKFYENGASDPYERFEVALKEVNRVIETLREEKPSHFIGTINSAIGAIVGEGLFISVSGDAEVYLIRRKFVSVISEGLAEETHGETFVNIASGSLERTDHVLFSSSRLLRYITKGELGKIFGEAGVKIGQALAELQDFVMTEILGRAAVIGVAMKEVSDEVLGEEQEEEGFEPQEEGALASVMASTTGVRAKVSSAARGVLGALSSRIPWFKNLARKVSSQVARLPSMKKPKINFFNHPEWKRERFLLSAALLLIFLVVGVFWLRARGDEQRQVHAQEAKLNEVKDIMNDVVTVGQFDKAKASEMLQAAEAKAREVLNSRYLRSEAVRTLDDIQSQRDTLDDIKRVTPTVLADFSEKRGTVNALGLLAAKDRVYGFEYNALYEVILDKLQDPLTINDIETVILGTEFADQGSLLFMTRTGKMIEFKDSRFVLVPTKDGIWKKGVDMKTYNDRAYVLDPERNQIWRYIRRRDGFDGSEAYNQDADVKKGVSLAIDASVYVLNFDGTITQLYQGKKKDFPLRKTPLSPITEPKRIFTNADLNQIYILEPSKQRVVVFRKDFQNGGAQYQTQYVFPNTGVLRDLTVIENRLYIMDDKKVYFVNLSGL